MSATYFRWAARGLSIPIVAFWGFFLVASLFGDAGRGPRPLQASDYITLAAIVTSLVGLCAAWRWEPAGAGMTLAVVMIGAAFNARILLSPAIVIPITACLFLAAWVAASRCQPASYGKS
jgi:hypothetical protein